MWDSVIWAVIVLALMYSWQIDRQHAKAEREMWRQERKDLMDRIQASSFAEYTNKVIREKKLEQPEEREETPEFVS